MNILEARRRLLEGGVKKRTAEGNPIVVRSLARMYPGLNIYGWSKQDGTPSPDNPVPIVSAGDEGEINVTVQGGNLLDEYFSSANRGVSNTVDGSVVTFNGTTDSGLGRVSAVIAVIGKLIPGVKYYFKHFSEYSIDCDFMVEDSSGTHTYRKNEYTPNGTEREINLRVLLNNTNNVSGMEIDMTVPVALTINPNMYAWEPYKQPQTLTVSTPGGLPRIPVSSGGNYTDADGQQWVCDEIDLSRGKYVQRVGKINVTLVDSYFSNENFGSINNPDNLLNTGLRVPILSNYFRFEKGIKNDGVGFAYLNTIRLYYALGSVEAFNEWLSQNDVVVYYPFATPIETPLSSEQISAYKGLHTYSPTTTVSNDAEAWMKVGYKTKKSLEVTT